MSDREDELSDKDGRHGTQENGVATKESNELFG